MKITNLAELLVRREFARKGVNLPNKFWNLPAYKKKYAMQMRLAATMFRTYSSEAIWNVIQREQWCFSLAAKCLPDKFQEEEEKLKSIKLRAEVQETKIDPALPKDAELQQTRFTKRDNLFD